MDPDDLTDPANIDKAGAAAYKAALTKILCFQHEFEVPATTKIDYDKTFGGNLRAEARGLLQRATRQRLRMSEGMTYEGCKVSPNNVIAAVDAYFPSIWQITASMEAAASTNVQLNYPLVFEWTSVLCNNETADAKAKKEKQPMTKKGRKLWRNNVLVYEVTEMLVVKALALYNQAGITVGAVAADDTSQHTAAATSLRQGAGAMDYIAGTLLPRWIKIPPDRPPEVLMPMLQSLSKMYIANAQELAVDKALKGPKAMPQSLMAKLFLGIVDCYHAAATKLRQLTREDFGLVDPALLDFLGFFPAIYRAVAMHYLAEAAYAKEEIGPAVALSHEAYRLMFALHPCQRRLAPLQGAVDAIKRECKRLADKFSAENDSIYFEAIPPLADIKDSHVPAGKVMMKPLPFAPAQPSVVSFSPIADAAPPPVEAVSVVADAPPPAPPAKAAAAGAADTAPKKKGGGFFSKFSRKKSAPKKDAPAAAAAAAAPAAAGGGVNAADVQKLEAMGFSKDKAEAALVANDGDVEKAVAHLLA